MKSYVGRIQVEDASGCRFDLHEFRSRRRLRPTRNYVLETGEAVSRADEHTFVISRTGETLMSVSGDDLTTEQMKKLFQGELGHRSYGFAQVTD